MNTDSPRAELIRPLNWHLSFNFHVQTTMNREGVGRGRRGREMREDGDGGKRKNEIGIKNATEGQKEIELKKFQRPTDKKI